MTYIPSGNPATGSEGLSALMRAEFVAIAAALGAQPRITTAGNYDTVLVQVGSFSFTLPATAGTLALVADVTAEAVARAAADALLAPKASPALTGTPTAPTATPGTNTLQLATTAFTAAAVAVETAARISADALLAPKADPAFTGTAGFAFTKTTPSAPVTAHAGGGQASATLLTAGLNRVTVVASNNDSVKLPSSVVGLVVEVSNEAVNTAAIFGFSVGDTVRGGSSSLLVGNTLGYYRCVAVGVWVGGTIT